MAKEPSSSKASKDAAAETKPATKPADTDAPRMFTVTRDVLHDGAPYVAGDEIPLTTAQHAQLFAVGAVAEDWRD